MITPGKEDSLKYWWLCISIQSGSRYIKLLPILFLFLQGWHHKSFLPLELAWELQCHVWMSAMQPGFERAINGHCMLKLFCFPFASALLDRTLHQMSAAICPWPTYRWILGIVEWPTWTRDLMQNTRKEYLRAQMQIWIIAPLGTEWLQGAVSDALCVSYWMNILEARWKLNNMPTPIHLPWISKAAWRWKKTWEVKHSVVKLRRNVWAISWTVSSGKLYLNLTRVEVSTARYTTELYRFVL